MRLRNWAPTGAFAMLSVASAGKGLPYPNVTDWSHATSAVATRLRDFFMAKSRHQPAMLMTYFAKDKTLYIDEPSGETFANWASLNQLFTTYMPKWPASGLSYPTRVYGDERSALVAFTDTPELFGKEMRIIAAVSFDNHGKVIRWIDYWDGRSSQIVTAPLKPT
jgi:hypothetical protein